MISEDKPQSRLYRVILLDRTTSPKINRYLRELTGKSVWEASAMMNNIPSVILSNIPLHKCIEIKAQLGRFGLSAKIESMIESEAAEITPKPAVVPARPVEEAPLETMKPHPPETAPVEKPAEAPVEPPFSPQPPGRLIRWKTTGKPLIYMLLPFIIFFIIVIIVIYLGEKGAGGRFFVSGKISSYEESGRKRAKMKFVPSKEDLAERLRKSRESMSSAVPEAGVDSSSLARGGEPSPGSQPGPGVSISEAVPPPASQPDMTGEKGAGVSLAPSSPAGGAGDKSHLPSPMPGQSSAAPAVSIPSGNKPSEAGQESVKGIPVSKEFIGGKEADGVSPEKLDNLTEHAQNALELGNLKAAAEDYQRFQMAEASLDDSPKETARRLQSPQAQNLRDELQEAAGKYGLQSELGFTPEIVGAKINIRTNLPDKSLAKVELILPGGEKAEEFVLPVEMGLLEIPYSGGLPSGIIIIKIILLPLGEQPEEAAQLLGKSGENMKGALVKGKGKVDYQGSISNNIARSRGEISKEEAERELQAIAAMNDLKQFKLSGFREYVFEEKLFVTISAEGVDEAEFILKACRSAGMLTQELDEPPPFLRLIVNGGQYFISTFYCRQVLREYGENDKAAFQFLLNYLFTL